MKKKYLIVIGSIGLVVVIGAVVAGLVLSSALATKASDHDLNAANGSSASGTIVIAWNKELLHIVKTVGAQPATVHPTRSYAILHAAIYDAIVSITRDAPAYLFSVPASNSARNCLLLSSAFLCLLVRPNFPAKSFIDSRLCAKLKFSLKESIVRVAALTRRV